MGKEGGSEEGDNGKRWEGKGRTNGQSYYCILKSWFCTSNLLPMLSFLVSFHKSTFSSLEDLKMILQMHQDS